MIQRILYLGLRPPDHLEGEVTHYPMIQIEPLDLTPCIDAWSDATHVLFTSQSSVKLLAPHLNFEEKTIVAVGKETARLLPSPLIATEETAEGVIAVLKTLDLTEAKILWPHSLLSRRIISDYLRAQKIEFREFAIYTTISQAPLPIPDLREFDCIYFTSPSTVDAFAKVWPEPPNHLELRAIGKITAKKIKLEF